MYAKQTAWLHARPKRHKNDENPSRRIDDFAEDDFRRKMPEIHGGEAIVQHWSDCGVVSQIMGGDTPLSWCEIRAYSLQSGADLDNWESKQIRAMSSAYASFKIEADNIRCLAPYRAEMTDDDRLRNALEFEQSMKRLKNMN